MKVRIRPSGLFNRSDFTEWDRELWKATRQAVGQGMVAGARPIVDKVCKNAATVFKLSGKKFTHSIRHKLYDKKPDRLPAVSIGSGIPWMGLHEEGGTVRGPLLIPLNQPKRIGRRAFKRIVNDLARAGNLHWVKKGGKVLLFAENIGENSRSLSRFRKSHRAITGKKRVKRGEEILIGVLVPSVTVRARLGLGRTVLTNIDKIVDAVERRLRAI